MMGTKRLVTAILGALGLSLAGGVFAAQKFDAHLTRLMALPPAAAIASGTAASPTTQPGYVETLLRFEGSSLARVTAAGGKVRSILGNIATVDIPISALAEITALPEVIYIEVARRQVQRLNFSVPATRANLLRGGTAPAFTGITGKNVIVGVVDDGLAFRHLDFRKADGSTRLIELWDQRNNGTAAGSPPTNYTYGGVCNATMLNNAINGDATACTQTSVGNHGTHVGGIAAGNGQQTGNGQAAYRFIGMAPEADILAANSLNAAAPGSAVVDAVAWMKARAQALGKPLVINLSLGSYFGARDGTSNYETALSNASGAGVIITGAAGNEGGDKIRAIGTISQGATQTVTFNWANSVASNQRLEMWYPGANQYSIKVTGPGVACGTATVLAGATQTFNPSCGQIDVTSTAAQVNNDDRQILVNFTISQANPTAFRGDWTIEITGAVVSAPNTPFSIICGEDGNGLLFTSNTETVTRSILTDSASATRVIAVGAYNTNYNWLTTGGVANSPPNHGPIGDISTFSSRGPRRDCSNLAKCPRVMKPDIAAPGAMIMSALGNDATAVTNDTKEQDGQHVAYNGTSMATPHVTGAIALMLQKNPLLTPEGVRQLLAQRRQTNAFTTNLPTFDPASPLMPAIQNDHWGYGILDAKASADAIPGKSTIVPLLSFFLLD